MALSADQTTAMNALAAYGNTGATSVMGRLPAKDMEIITKLLVDAWALSAVDAKTFRRTVHRDQNGMGDSS